MSSPTSRSVLVIGTGRAGSSFATALGAAGWRVSGPLGRDDDPVDAATEVDLVLICVTDAAVREVAARIRPGRAVVGHVAGSLGLDSLAPHVRRASVHPLVALPNADVGARRLAAGATFAVAGDGIAAEVVAALHGRAIRVDDEHRAAYHAAACIASNHVVALLGQVERVAASAGVPLDAFWDLIAGTIDNVRSLGPAAALTGPASRGDGATIEAHLAAMNSSERPAYEAMVAAAQRLASPSPTPASPTPASPTPRSLNAEPSVGRLGVQGSASDRDEGVG